MLQSKSVNYIYILIYIIIVCVFSYVIIGRKIYSHTVVPSQQSNFDIYHRNENSFTLQSLVYYSFEYKKSLIRFLSPYCEVTVHSCIYILYLSFLSELGILVEWYSSIFCFISLNRCAFLNCHLGFLLAGSLTAQIYRV